MTTTSQRYTLRAVFLCILKIHFVVSYHPYFLNFEHHQINLQQTCTAEFYNVRDFIYKSYVNDLIAETTITLDTTLRLDPSWPNTTFNFRFFNESVSTRRQLRHYNCKGYCPGPKVSVVVTRHCCNACTRCSKRRLIEDEIIRINDRNLLATSEPSAVSPVLPTMIPSTAAPSASPTTRAPSFHSTSAKPSSTPTANSPTFSPISLQPTAQPTSNEHSFSQTTDESTSSPITDKPSSSPITDRPSSRPITDSPTVASVTELSQTRSLISTDSPVVVAHPTTAPSIIPASLETSRPSYYQTVATVAARGDNGELIITGNGNYSSSHGSARGMLVAKDFYNTVDIMFPNNHPCKSILLESVFEVVTMEVVFS